MSRNRKSTPRTRFWMQLAAMACTVAMPALAQYPGRVDPNQSKPQPVLRATAVLEYTGELTKPTASRLVPLAVWDGERYQPGGLYMAQPMPLAVETGTQYELYTAGVSKGLYDVRAAANIDGSWIAVGNFQKPIPPQAAKLHKSKTLPIMDGVNYDDGKPHFAHRPAPTPPADSKSTSSGSGSQSGSSSAPPADSDRPVLHRRETSDSSTNSGSPSGNGSSTSKGTTSSTSSSSSPVDPDRPTMHRPSDSSSSGSGSSGSSTASPSTSSTTASHAPETDPDRPKLHRGRSNSNDNGAPVSATNDIDPDRPRLRHGRPVEYEKLDVPANVEIDKVEKASQNVELIAAVSDARIREPHPYTYSWNSPEEEQKTQASLEDQARVLLGGTPAPKPATATTKKAIRRTTRTKTAVPAPLVLNNEVFKAYELSFGGGATLVFSASVGQGDATKYVTLIAQPEFDGTPQVIFKQVTSGPQLDIVPRMEIVDAVDTDADNRAELIFALTGSNDHQYAIYRVADHSVEEVFNTAGS